MTIPRSTWTEQDNQSLMLIGDRHKSQSDKFKELAREVEADEDEEVLKRALKKMREEPKEKKPAKD